MLLEEIKTKINSLSMSPEPDKYQQLTDVQDKYQIHFENAHVKPFLPAGNAMLAMLDKKMRDDPTKGPRMHVKEIRARAQQNEYGYRLIKK
jgi:hypothetical protein